MRRLLLPFLLLTGLTGVANARSGFPSPITWTLPAHVNLVCSADGVPDSATGSFEAVIRDLAMNPIPGSEVVLDLSGLSDMRLCVEQRDPRLLVRCTQQTVRAFADANGRARFTVLGGGRGPASSLAGSAKIYADGVLGTGASFGVAAYDLDGVGGVGGNDLSVWLGEFLTGSALQRVDYDGSGAAGGNDFSLLLGVFGSGRDAESCSAYCP